MKRIITYFIILFFTSCSLNNNYTSINRSSDVVNKIPTEITNLNRTFGDEIGNCYLIYNVYIDSKYIYIDGDFNLIYEVNVEDIYISVGDVGFANKKYDYYLKITNEECIVGKERLLFPIEEEYFNLVSNNIDEYSYLICRFGIKNVLESDKFPSSQTYFESRYFSNECLSKDNKLYFGDVPKFNMED